MQDINCRGVLNKGAGGCLLIEPEPPRDCPRCPRLLDFRLDNRLAQPNWFNAPVPSFGPKSSRFLVVGLAPGLKGANRTGRPFTGDYAGLLLYNTLIGAGFASGPYNERPDDGLTLMDCRITNTVRCVPPQNKPLPTEIASCSSFLAATIAEMASLRAILALGKIAFDAVLRTFCLKPSQNSFVHGRTVQLTHDLQLFGSYHCSRYNTNTGRLTAAMFEAVIHTISTTLASGSD